MNHIPFNVSHNSLLNSEEFFDDFFNSYLVKKTFSLLTAPESFKVDIYKKGSKYIFEADLPGFNKDDIRVEFSHNFLVISAERTPPKDAEIIQQEKSYGSLRRMFYVDNIYEGSIDIRYYQGLLLIEMTIKNS